MAIVLLALGIVWLAVLSPFALRKLSEYQVSTSVANFRHRLSRLQRAQPNFVTSSSAVAPDRREPDRSHAVSARPSSPNPSRQAARYKMERRRRTLIGFGGVIIGTLLFGAIPALRPLWYFTLVAVIFCACYLALLAYAVRIEMLEAEKRQKVVRIGPPRADVSSPRGIAAVGGGSRDQAQLFQMRPLQPAFRLVERPMSSGN